jgi:hypothetical protein
MVVRFSRTHGHRALDRWPAHYRLVPKLKIIQSQNYWATVLKTKSGLSHLHELFSPFAVFGWLHHVPDWIILEVW